MKDKLPISIIIPVYNNEKFLPNAVESVLNQDFEDYELIIVDDGSTDNTGKIADEYALKDARIKVVHQENQWIYASFNRGIREACGEYIYILNSDDSLCPNVLGHMYENVLKYKPDVIFTKVLIHQCDLEQNILIYNRSKIDLYIEVDAYYDSKEKVRKAWPYFEKSNLAHNQANLYKREIMLAHPFRNDVYGADTLFNIEIAPYIKTAVEMGRPVYNHFIYDHESMNASYGKFYTYEHAMFNEIYNGFIGLFQSWELDKADYEEYFARFRFNQFIQTLRKLKSPQCKFTNAEKIKEIVTHYADDTIAECASILDIREELECRILSSVREMLIQEPLQDSDEMYFVQELLEALLRYEKEDADYMKIKNAIQHPQNPCKIGEYLYRKLQ